MNRALKGLFAVIIMIAACSLAYGSVFDFSQLQKSIVEKTLPNGLKIIVLPRHEVPVVSMVTWADVGGSDDPKGYTGMAHMFEHMAFKGTDEIGTTDPAKEVLLMAKEDAIFEQLRLERLKGDKGDKRKLERLEKDFEKAIADAYALIVPNAFSNKLENEGAEGLNAFTSKDQTAYMVSLPSNKFELWMALESERFLRPRLREMYREREVVAEERRMTVENRPMSRLLEEFLSTAFKAHPYGVPLIGHSSDIQNYSRSAAKDFFDKYYGPNNLTLAIVGDVKPEKVFELAEKYWARIPSKYKPERVATVEPTQICERTVIMPDKAQPIILMGWHIPDETHKDMPALSALSSILGSGRTSRLYRRMVRDDKAAVSVSAFSGWPGSKYPCLSVVFCYPAQGKSASECDKIILEEIEKIKNASVTPEELERVKTGTMTGLIAGLKNNMGLAQNLAQYNQIWGDWRALFGELDRINAVTCDDIQRVAKKYFVKTGRTLAVLETAQESEK